jgi:hypothetical protein
MPTSLLLHLAVRFCASACLLALLTACDGGGGDSTTTTDSDTTTDSTTDTTTTLATYSLLAWNDLGMHCMDGDYSVMSILPPYNTVHAQLVNRQTHERISQGVTLSYTATPDTAGSINTYSAGKTNFWLYVDELFGVQLNDDMGLAGYPMASTTPVALAYETTHEWFTAEGIPITPTDDALQTNPYPMVMIAAHDATSGALLAQAPIVLPVSDEMNCAACHTTGTVAEAMPPSGWVNDLDPDTGWRKNVLKLHDERHLGDADYQTALVTAGYLPTGLLDSALNGNPTLCASCHPSNALPGLGIATLPPLTQAVHGEHAEVTDPATGLVLDDSDARAACYTCHPGSETKCLRDAMGANPDITCQSCHGNLSAVASEDRRGWFDQPTCQACHFDSTRTLTVFDASGVMREPADTTFATDPDTPITGASLYRFSTGHGGLQCSACHGSPHAIFPTLEPNDNRLSLELQNYAGTIRECTVCHDPVPYTATGGPHGMHAINGSWVSGHGDWLDDDSERTATCAYCHGADYRGSFLSEMKIAKSFAIEDGTKTYQAGDLVSCYDCHNGPSGD